MNLKRFRIEFLEASGPGIHLVRQDIPSDGFNEIAFDSRRLPDAPSTLFVALKGQHRDGHAFVSDAYAKGVRHFLLHHPEVVPGPAVVWQSEDPLLALQQMAGAYRQTLPYPVLAITGSNGKTVVKEWLSSVLVPAFRIGKSPASFNSQIGVPVSILELRKDHELALLEAGISLPGEMAKIEAMIQPDWGIMTHFGDAHSEGFESETQKLNEKLSLFKKCQRIFLSADNPMVHAGALGLGVEVFTAGRSEKAGLRLLDVKQIASESVLTLSENGSSALQLRFPFTGEAAVENVLLVIMVARQLGMEWDAIQRELIQLYPVSMRTELISDNPEISIINDAYNADKASLRNALGLLEADQSHKGKALILSDLEHLGRDQEKFQREILDDLLKRFRKDQIFLIGPVFSNLAQSSEGVKAWMDTGSFLSAFDYDRFKSCTVLIKGARKFALERILPFLSRRAVSTWSKVNLNHLAHNFQCFRSHLPSHTKMMCMVKAFSYGAGTWEIAQELANLGADYLAVAYTSEGILLRTRGIHTPIMVMNADTESIEQLYRFGLEPEIYSLDFLRTYVRMGRSLGAEEIRVHLKLDTGMHRLGFGEAELDGLKEYLQQHPEVTVVSVFSHLSAADEPSLDTFTRDQIKLFEQFVGHLGLGPESNTMRHLLNTAGILRFPENCFEMVRLGIGLYGVSPLEEDRLGLKEIGSLHTVVTQIHDYPAGTPIGYGCSTVLNRPSRVATIPVGYADGIRRSLSNGVGHFLVRGVKAPVVGRVCMDMLMLDVTDIAEVQAGDEVTLIGKQGEAIISVADLARWCTTIPYEILTGISQRVRRVYVRE
jgi:alanine racemase